jgi:DNA invertase Pin-like site-specific DNA recombinase
MRKIGYARVSAQHQNLDRQLGALVAEGCERVFKEKASGRSTTGRPELEKAIGALGTGDVLVLPEWDRATRSMLDGIQIIQRVAPRGALGESSRQAVPGSDQHHGTRHPGFPERARPG